MADGQEVDVLEEGLRAEERSPQLDEMRLMWRAEAEKAAQYFSAIPGFGHFPAEVSVPPPVQPGPASPDPYRPETTAEPSPDEVASGVGTTGGTTTVKEDKISRAGLLIRLRQRLGRRPRNRQVPAEERAVAEELQPQLNASEEPGAAEESPSRAKRFHSSF
jgi:hypothetical protein